MDHRKTLACAGAVTLLTAGVALFLGDWTEGEELESGVSELLVSMDPSGGAPTDPDSLTEREDWLGEVAEAVRSDSVCDLVRAAGLSGRAGEIPSNRLVEWFLTEIA